MSIAIGDRNAAAGSTNNILYILEVDNSATGDIYTMTEVSGKVYGTHVDTDIAGTGFKLYSNNIPSLSGSPVLIYSVDPNTSPYSFNATGLSIAIAAHGTKYIIATADIAAFATHGDVLYFNGATDPMVPVFSGSPSVTNSQEDNSGIVLITA